jgi:enamine deaminase RidA (YjgF/YER057c/UK114 family)
MSDGQGTLTVRYGVRSDIGLHRQDNEDAAYAGAEPAAHPAEPAANIDTSARPPASTTVQVTALAMPDLTIEIEAWAVCAG